MIVQSVFDSYRIKTIFINKEYPEIQAKTSLHWNEVCVYGEHLKIIDIIEKYYIITEAH